MEDIERKYFFLNSDCFLVQGKDGSAIYNLSKESVYEIDTKIGTILKKNENKNSSVDKILNNYPENERKNIKEYLNDLSNEGLGFWSKKYVVVEKITSPYKIKKEYDKKDESGHLNKLIIEITKECDLNCVHCDIAPTVLRCLCFSEKKLFIERSELTFPEIKKILEDAKLFDCNKLYITGGEPFLKKQLISSIVNYSRKLGFRYINIRSNINEIDTDILNILKENEISVSTIFYSYRAEIYNKITRCENSYENWKKNIIKLLDNDIEVYVDIEIMRINQKDIDDTILMLKNFGIKRITIRYIISDDDEFQPYHYKKGIANINNVVCVNSYQYFKNKYGNSCWDGKIAITHLGDVVPCLLARKEIIGNIRKISLAKLLRKRKMKLYWNLSRDELPICMDCEFRYACFNCRPIENYDSLFGENKWCEKITNSERG